MRRLSRPGDVAFPRLPDYGLPHAGTEERPRRHPILRGRGAGQRRRTHPGRGSRPHLSGFHRLLPPGGARHAPRRRRLGCHQCRRQLPQRLYPHPAKITACGLGEGDDFHRAFPAVSYVRIEARGPLPFRDDEFAIATSNAVLEHVGGDEEQARHVRELFRVAPRVFISVPHRYFPVEHHTSLPFLHWTDATFRWACGGWQVEMDLAGGAYLMSRRRLRSLVPPGAAFKLGYTGLKLGPFSSNIFLFLHR